MIELRTLGLIDVRVRGGARLRSIVTQPKRIALLTYLAMATPRGPQRRDKLTAMFWPDSDAGHARASLRKAIHALRRSLGPKAVATVGDNVELRSELCWCDAVAVSNALAAGREDEAVALYRGALLDGVFVRSAPPIEHWIDGERARLRSEVGRAVRRLIASSRERGEMVRAATIARNWLAVERDESTVQQLMELLCRLGNPAAALEVYSDFTARQARESAPGPSAATRMLAERIKARPSDPAKPIVVLPFTTADERQNATYVATGIADDVLAALARIPALRVISRNSSLRLHGTDKDVRTIGRELSVDYVLQGDVSVAGATLQVRVRLLDARSDVLLWANTYAGVPADVLDLQSRIVRDIVQSLEIVLTPDEERRLAGRRITNMHAYECYHRAREQLWRFHPQALDRAVELIQTGLDLAPDDELLVAAQGHAFFHYVVFNVRPDRDACLAKVLECAARIREHNPDSPHCHAFPALVQFLEGDRQSAVNGLKQALMLDPNNADWLTWLIALYARVGHPRPGRALQARLLEIDPLTPITHQHPGWFDLIETGDAGSCVRSCRRVYDMDSQSPYGRFVYAAALAWDRRFEDAVHLLDQIVRDTPTHGFAWLGQVLRHALRGERDAVLAGVTPALATWAALDDVASWVIADCYALVREADQAAHWVGNAAKRGGINYPMFAKHDVLLTNVRSAQVFQAVLNDVRSKWERFVP